jgi:hypothetical protein
MSQGGRRLQAKGCADRIWIGTYGAVERSNFLLRIGSDMVSGDNVLGFKVFFGGERKRRVWVELTAAANFCSSLTSALDSGGRLLPSPGL